jgi:hypothetical protein
MAGAKHWSMLGLRVRVPVAAHESPLSFGPTGVDFGPGLIALRSVHVEAYYTVFFVVFRVIAASNAN